MDAALQRLQNHLVNYDLLLSPENLQEIVDLCAEIIVMQDQQEFEDRTRESIDMGGGCSACGDLSGFECTCEEDDDEPYCPFCDTLVCSCEWPEYSKL